MNSDRIIEKAKKLGISTTSSNSLEQLEEIALNLGLNGFNPTTDSAKLEAMLDEQLGYSGDIESLDDGTELAGGAERPLRFGEKEYNDAKNKDGVYDKNYYANKGKELDQKVENAKAEKARDFKKKDPKDNGPFKADGSNAIGKNKFDKAKDSAALMKAKKDRFQNKISNAKAKWFNATHPVQALKNKAKAGVKKVAKNSAKAIGKALKAGLKMLWATPYGKVIIICLGVILLFFILIILFAFFFGGLDSESSNKNNNTQGLYGYNYVEPAFTQVTVTNGNYQGTYDIEEYVAGVVEAEANTFFNSEQREAAKALTIAIRSFVLKRANSGEIEASSNTQNFMKASQYAIDLANETRGLVLVNSEEEIITAMYDAFCTKNPPETDPLNYILCQKNQEVPKSWADNESILDEWKNGTMSGAHGEGMSAWGAAYLSEQGKTYTEILDYYYDNSQIYSIYPSMIVGDNWTTEINIWASSAIPTTILRQPLTSLMSRSEYTSFNQLIRDSVVAKGVGTRDAIVAAAVIPIKYLAENYNVVLPYTLGGGHYMEVLTPTGVDVQHTTSKYYGLDPKWGTIINHTWSGNYYDEYGPDCSAWVPWVYKNAGIKISPALGFAPLGVKYSTSEYIGRPGDLLEGSGHVMVIVGVDKEAGVYYISHASGGNYGTIISTVSLKTEKYYVVDMTKYIENNVIETYEEDFMKGLLSY